MSAQSKAPTLTPGTRLGAYEIVGAIGAGGMGEVFRGRDAALNRDAAIKVLPADMASDPEGIGRFRREAQVLASLNHSNIAHVYGFETAVLPSGSTAHFLAMELVEGEDLSRRLSRGPIPMHEAILIARQLVDGLEEAHERGIVHRDLKPANIKVGLDGKVKVLDFGLAKAFATTPHTATEDTHTSHLEATAEPMTQSGMIMGTASYMAPEQARGQSVDKRVDIWAFGVVLYEMLTGKRLFKEATASDTLAAVLTRDPDMKALPFDTPHAVRSLVRHCLERDPKQRLRDIGDARLALQNSEVAPLPATSIPPRNRWTIAAPWILTVAALTLALLVSVPAARTKGSPPASPVKLVIRVAGDAAALNPVLSSDASFLVYQADQLYLRRLNEFESKELLGTLNAQQPFLSPDGKWVAFFSDGKMKRLALAGGEPLPIADTLAESPGAAFISNDRILFTRGWNQAPLLSVSAEGGPVTPVSTVDAGANERGHWWPRILPDGRHVLFTIWYRDAGLHASRIAVLDLETGKHRVLLPGAMAQYGAGHLLYYRAGRYQLVGFDPSTLTVVGEPQPVLTDAFGLSLNGDEIDPVSVAVNGTVAYSPGELNPSQTLEWIDRLGQRTATSLSFGIQGASLSPDDRYVVVGRPQGGASSVWIHDLGGGEQRLQASGSNWAPVWSQDGRTVAYTTVRKGDFDVATHPLDGVDRLELDEDLDESPVDWLSDGRLLIKKWLPDGRTLLSIAEPGGKKLDPLATLAFTLYDARVSHDGRFLAFCVNVSGRPFLYARSLSESGAQQQLSSVSSNSCGVRWSASTKELMFLRGESVVALAYAERDGRFVATGETVLATLPPRSDVYGVSRDGQRVLVGVPTSSPPTTPGIRVIVNGITSLLQPAR